MRAKDGVAWIGNLGGVGFGYVRVLNARGQHADLFLPRGYLRRQDQGNPDHEWCGASELPFLKAHRRNALNYGLNRLGVLGYTMGFERHIGRNYAIVQAMTCNEISALRIKRATGVPYVAMATGSDLSEVAAQDSRFGELYRRSLEEAEHLFLLNLDQFETVERLGLAVKSKSFLPFAVDFDRLLESPNHVGRELRLFCASRLDWTSTTRASTKGNDVFFRGLAAYLRGSPGRLVRVAVADWGLDREAARALVRDLGIDSVVDFVPYGDKGVFQTQVQLSNVVVDQFRLGATGLTAVEAMALGRPVMAFCKQHLAKKAYGEEFPVLNCADEGEVCACLASLRPQRIHEKSAEVAAWVRRAHSPERIHDLLMNVYQSSR